MSAVLIIETGSDSHGGTQLKLSNMLPTSHMDTDLCRIHSRVTVPVEPTVWGTVLNFLVAYMLVTRLLIQLRSVFQKTCCTSKVWWRFLINSQLIVMVVTAQNLIVLHSHPPLLSGCFSATPGSCLHRKTFERNACRQHQTSDRQCELVGGQSGALSSSRARYVP